LIEEHPFKRGAFEVTNKIHEDCPLRTVAIKVLKKKIIVLRNNLWDI
jgi:hypothetical protein